MILQSATGLEIIAPRPGQLSQYAEQLTLFLAESQLLGLDVETTGLDPDADLRLVQLASRGYRWDFTMSDPIQRALIRHLFEDTDRRWVSHTSIDPRMLCKHLGLHWTLAHRMLDSWTLACLLEPGDVASHGLKDLTARFLDPHLKEAEADLYAEFARLKGPKPRKPAKPAKSKSSKPEFQARYLEKYRAWREQVAAWEAAVTDWDSFEGWRDIPTDNPVYLRYSGLDPWYALRLMQWQLPRLEDVGIPQATLTDEMRFYQICLGMTIRGQRVDADYARDVALGDHLRTYDASRAEFQKLTGMVSGSPRFADWLIARKVKLTEKTDKGAWSLKKQALEAVHSRYLTTANPDPDAVRALELKEAIAGAQNYVTFTRSVLANMDHSGFIHPVFKNLGAETGRMSATDPAVQTVKGAVTRGIIIPTRPDEVLVSIDLSQIEPRIAAALSGEETLIQVFVDGIDLYDAFTQMIFPGPVVKRNRSAIKRTVLATLYVGGIQVIITQLRQLDGIVMSEDEVGRIRRELWRLAPTLRAWGKSLEKENPIWLESGRFGPVHPDREWKNINTKVQGTARDALRDCIFRVQEAGYEDTVINLIHDEGIFSLPCATLDSDIRVIQKCFEVPFHDVPVVTEVEVYEGGRWGHGKRIWTNTEAA